MHICLSKVFEADTLKLKKFTSKSVSEEMEDVKQNWYESLSWSIDKYRDFPGGAVVESLPANVGDTGSSPGPGRSHMPWSNKAHAPQLLSLHSRAREPQLLSPCTTTTEAHVPWSPCSATREATAMRSTCTATKSSPRSPQLEKARTQQRRPSAAKNK